MIDPLWLSIGLLGQACYTARFLVQWLASERRRQTIVPVSFWYFSIGGGVVLLAYAVHRRDFVFGLGQASGLFVYVRNLSFARQAQPESRHAAAAGG